MIEIEIEDEAWTTALPDAEALVRRAAEAALAFDAQAPAPPETEAITVLLTDDAAVRELNARFRDKDSPTNVLSFPAAETAYPHLGDIALAYGVCAREAEAQDKPLAHHLSHLVVHGTLHLLGYDHQADAEAEAMEAIERAILAGLDIPDPYSDRGGLAQDGAPDHG
ncbi:MAG: rRNA maturation RNase YbeY [Caulobacteraceae bacterium]